MENTLKHDLEYLFKYIPATRYTLEDRYKRTQPQMTPKAPMAKGKQRHLPPEIDFLSRKNPQIGEKMA